MSAIIQINNYLFTCPDLSISLLEILERENIQIDYQCRQGFCGSCRVRLITGKVKYFEEPIAFIPQDHILPCCCHIDDDIIIELNHLVDKRFL